MKTILTVCIAAVCTLTIPTHARIGETEQQVEARYGPAVSKPKMEKGREKSRTYRFGGLEITVTFLDRKSQREDYIKLDGGKLASSEIQELLKANSGVAEWKNTSETEWVLPNGAVTASYMDLKGLPPKFSVETKEYNALLGAEVQPEKPKAKK